MSKTLLAILVSTFLVTNTLASETIVKKEEKPPTKKEEKAPSKKEDAKKEKVCIDKVKDGKPILNKEGKPEQVCKEVKIHEKLEGNKVPDKK